MDHLFSVRKGHHFHLIRVPKEPKSASISNCFGMYCAVKRESVRDCSCPFTTKSGFHNHWDRKIMVLSKLTNMILKVGLQSALAILDYNIHR